MNMTEEKIISFVSCEECKHFEYYGYCEGEKVTACELGRYREHMEAEKNNGLCECDYWEAK